MVYPESPSRGRAHAEPRTPPKEGPPSPPKVGRTSPHEGERKGRWAGTASVFGADKCAPPHDVREPSPVGTGARLHVLALELPQLSE